MATPSGTALRALITVLQLAADKQGPNLSSFLPSIRCRPLRTSKPHPLHPSNRHPGKKLPKITRLIPVLFHASLCHGALALGRPVKKVSQAQYSVSRRLHPLNTVPNTFYLTGPKLLCRLDIQPRNLKHRASLDFKLKHLHQSFQPFLCQVSGVGSSRHRSFVCIL